MLGAILEGARIDDAGFKNAYVKQDQIDEVCGRPRPWDSLLFAIIGLARWPGRYLGSLLGDPHLPSH